MRINMAVEGQQRLMTKTQHYRKVTKPLLERKRRARMNLYLDELKDLIVDTMETQGEHVNKLEKADILEMTVTYLKSRKHEIAAAAAGGVGTAAPALNVEKFRAGYTQAAYEVSKVFASLPGLDLKFGACLMKQLGHQLKEMPQSPMSSNESQHSSSCSEEDFDFAKPHGYDRREMGVDSDRKPAMNSGGDVWRPW